MQSTVQTPLILTSQADGLAEISQLDRALERHFSAKLKLQIALTRQMVSFQANKDQPAYRWYKYKEAFSASLVSYLLNHYRIQSGKILDPFAGAGTALFAAREAGLDGDGIELLPIGQQIILTRLMLEDHLTPEDRARLGYWADACPWESWPTRSPLPRVRITEGAYPPEALEAIERYLGALKQEQEHVQAALRFALLCVLEAVSFTRKDGQYLRWDDRSGRRVGTKKKFDKGALPGLREAIAAKLREILSDLQTRQGEGASGVRNLELFPSTRTKGQTRLYAGSCLDVMPTLQAGSYDGVITSPPYCNRYDYTRTYALELALLGVGGDELINLRQQMLSCTVENRAKDLLKINPGWGAALAAAEKQPLLQAILRYLDDQRQQGRLNNNGIPRMVRGYFYEMACVIAECARVLKRDARMLMVNDNVRYAGASISVDMILSSMAEALGFQVENILVLPNGKGNSSQQMGEHGRSPLRKCVYVWRKT